jgi:hypothetical protein
MQFGDTADYKSALRRQRTSVNNLRRKTKFSGPEAGLQAGTASRIGRVPGDGNSFPAL